MNIKLSEEKFPITPCNAQLQLTGTGSFQQDNVERSQRDFNYSEQESRRTQSQVMKCEQNIVRHQKESQDLQIDIEKSQSVLEHLQDALDQDASAEGRLDALKDQLSEAEQEKMTHEGSYQESVAAKDKLFQDLIATRQQMAELDVLIKESTAKKLKAEVRAAQRRNQREEALRVKNGALEAAVTASLDRDTCVVERDRHEEYVQDFNKQATDFCPRVVVDDGETPESLERKYKKLEKDVERAEGRYAALSLPVTTSALLTQRYRLGGSQAKLAANARKALLAFQQAEAEVNSANDLVRVSPLPPRCIHERLIPTQLLKTTLENRKQRWRHFRSHIIARARIQFFYLVSERGFRGRLLVNNKEKRLDLQVSMMQCSLPPAHNLMSHRWSPTERKGMPKVITLKFSQGEKSHSRQFVCCSQYGRRWVLPFVAWMSSTYSWTASIATSVWNY